MSIEFSIVIPTLDSEKYLEETIQSIKSQDRSIQIEIIFSDGGSKDNTLKMIDNLNQENLTKVILYNQVGLSNAINEGLKISKGKYLSYLNSDDQLDINALKVLKKKFEDDENKEWIIGLCKNIGNSKILNSIINYYKSSLLKKLNFNLLCINNIISQPSVYWKRSLFEKVGNSIYRIDWDGEKLLVSSTKNNESVYTEVTATGNDRKATVDISLPISKLVSKEREVIILYDDEKPVVFANEKITVLRAPRLGA